MDNDEHATSAVPLPHLLPDADELTQRVRTD